MGKVQKGVLLHKGAVTCTEIAVPQPPPDHNKVDPASYRCERDAAQDQCH